MPTPAGQALRDSFARIRIINLKARADRRHEMARNLSRLGLTADGGHVAFHEACRPADRGGFSSIGARGCFMSHLAVLRDAEAAGSAHVLIMEDDLDFSKDIETRLPATLAQLRTTDWAIFYGGHERYAGPEGSDLLTEADPAYPIVTAHFVAFSRPAIQAAIPYLEHMLSRPAGDPAGGPMHVDGAYSWFRRSHPQLVTLLAFPVLGTQRPSRTDIHSLGLIDRTPGLRGLANMARRVKRRLI